MKKEEYEIYREQLQIIQDFVSEEIVEDANLLVERLRKMNVYIASCGQIYADVKKIQNREMEASFEANDWLFKAPATIATKYVESKCQDANYLVNWCDRLSRAMVHISDNCRTIISYKKQELVLTRTGY